MPPIRTPFRSISAALRSPATLVPVIIIAVLAAGLAAHQIITRWDQINPGRGWTADAASKIPDEADAAVVINLVALRKADRRDTVNLWRVAAVNNGAADLTSWADTGHAIGDENLAAMKATRITWMRLSAQGGQAVTVDASPTQSTAQEDPPADNKNRWTKLPTPRGFTLLQNPASAGIVNRKAADKSLAAASDYQQASRAIDEPNFIFAFARWRSLPAGMIPAIAHPLSCDADKWIAAGINVQSRNDVTITIACPYPPGQWGSGPLQTAAEPQENWDAIIGATFANDWNVLQAGPAADAVSWIAGPIVTSSPEASTKLIAQLTGDAWFAYRQLPEGDQWSLTLPFQSDPSEITNYVQAIIADNEQSKDDQTSTQSIRHPAFPDQPVNITVAEASVILGNTNQPTELSPHQSHHRATGRWNHKAMNAWANQVWPDAAPWIHKSKVKMTARVDAAVNIYQAEVEFQD